MAVLCVCAGVGLGSSGENSTYAQTDSPTLWSLDLWLDCEDPQLMWLRPALVRLVGRE